ncbi:GMP synthase family protein [Leptolyngbya sp. PCC 7375]|nr:GMP synthase family protein [Leptolyngbya sp. PCC 7375]
MKTAIAIRHIAFEDVGSLAPVLEDQRYSLQYLDAGADDLANLDPASPDLLIILGGPIGAYDEQDYPFLKDELRILKHRLEADLPTLGICLGAQLIARVLGAKVYPGSAGKEIGWSPIKLSEAGHQSVLQPLATADAVLHWHGDTFTLPDGCDRLASSAKYENQAFSYKQTILALQFHPEVITQTVGKWFIGHACEISSTTDVTIATLRQDTQKYGKTLQHLASLCWRQWLNQIEQATHLRNQPVNV